MRRSNDRHEARTSLRRIRRRTAMLCLALMAMLALFLCAPVGVKASGDLDRIRDYEITVDVNPDGTLTMRYHVEWEVLDSDSEGPLSWVNIGVPNKHVSGLQALSSTISELKFVDYNGYNMRIDFDREYFEGEVVSFDYSLVQDYMYEMNRFTDGETVYEFTPGWFDGILVDNMVIRWNSAGAESWSPSCEFDGDYLLWKTSLGKGERYTVQITYLNDAFGFDDSKTFEQTEEDDDDAIYGVFGLLVLLGAVAFPIFAAMKSLGQYNNTANFGTSSQKITRTRIEYYPNCPGCGAARPEGKDNCEYCGRSFIKSETKIEEKDIPKEEKELKSRNTNGTYRYSSSPNTYMRVHVVNVPVSSGGHRSHSSCAHSSCAHSSCACACACACAGGGRAGCTTKDFYNTNLKLRYLRQGHR
ncbi:MAG: hypothetical protein K5696_02700 [Lachnospiraceae bacterium]|nr:hypothetical protein [Lachnospiraceae bacterium]